MMMTNYLGSVKKKENREWTLPEMAKIFTLRVNNGEDPEDIARKFHATKIQVYNIVRMMRAGIVDKCFMCRNPLTPAEIRARKPGKLLCLCFKCKKETVQYKRKIRKDYIRRGLCGYCGKERLVSKTAGRHCISATYRRNLNRGLCGHCGKDPVRPGGSMCDTCTDIMRVRALLRRTTA